MILLRRDSVNKGELIVGEEKEIRAATKRLDGVSHLPLSLMTNSQEEYWAGSLAVEDLRRSSRRGTGGRPTREEAEARDARLLDVAATLFMERGLGGTSLLAVAEIAGVSKTTLYARYRDKRELFAAVLRNRIRRWLAPLAAATEAKMMGPGTKSFRTILDELSRQMIAYTLAPEAATLHRLLFAQAFQFPELAKFANEEGWLRAVRGVSSLLIQAAARGEIQVVDPELSAHLFLNLVLGHCQRLVLYGISGSPEAEERYRNAAVDLFFDGVRVR
jgi:TetR/AcrR family transcriptional regulator, mexJK operon transcriptional repressor